MRTVVREFAEICSTVLPIKGPIYEFGSFITEGQEVGADIRSIFPGKEYYGTDFRPGHGVDTVLDLHNIALPNNAVKTVICLETLEHVEYPWKAMEEIHRITNSNGIVIISSSMNLPIHNYPFDYWRFTPESFRSLLKQFKVSFVESAGHPRLPHTVVGIGFKSDIQSRIIEELQKRIKLWKKTWRDPYNNFLEKYVKQIFNNFGLDVHRKIPE
jgi:hypothetical protein